MSGGSLVRGGHYRKVILLTSWIEHASGAICKTPKRKAAKMANMAKAATDFSIPPWPSSSSRPQIQSMG